MPFGPANRGFTIAPTEALRRLIRENETRRTSQDPSTRFHNRAYRSAT